jgi:hypothetical protein
MTLKSDAQGFLIGELIETNTALLAGQEKGNRVLGNIRSDVSAIARALGIGPGGAARKTVEPAQRGSGRATERSVTPRASESSGRSMAAQRTSANMARSGAVATPRGRDTQGRFIKASESTARQTVEPLGRDGRGRFTPGGGGGDQTTAEKSGLGSQVLDRLGRVADAFKGSAGDVQQVDPTLAAAQEIQSVVEPLGRGVFALFGRTAEKKKEGWFKRIIASLKTIERKPTGNGAGPTIQESGGSSGFLGNLAGSFFGSRTGGRGGIFSRLLGLGGAAAAAGGSGAAAAAVPPGAVRGGLGGLLQKGGGLLKGAGGLLKRIPVLGALLAGGGALASIYGPEDPSKSADENRKEKYKGVGGSFGMVAGGALGAALGSLAGPLGTVVGGYLGSMGGEIIGEKVGEWTKTLVDADIPGKVVKVWGDFVVSAKERWEAMKGGASALVDDAKNLANKVADKAVSWGNEANRAIQNTTGVDVKEVAKSVATVAADAAKTAATVTTDFVVENAPKLVPNTIKRLVDSVGTKRVYDMADGQTEARTGGSVSWRNNNPGNLKFENSESADPTVKSKRTKAQALAAAQSRYDGVVDLDQWGNAIFATEEQGRAAKSSLLKTSHGGKTIEEMLPKYAVTDYSGKANPAAYASGIYKSADSQGADLRGKKIGDLSPTEMNALLDGMKRVEGYKVGQTSITGVSQAYAPPPMPTISVASIPTMPDIKIPEPPRDSERDRPLNVVVSQPVSQEVSDRGIAHYAAGGLGRPRGW